MERVDASGKLLGGRFPAYPFPPSSKQIWHWTRETGQYPTPSGSGNVYSREYLDKLFPLDRR